MKILVTGGAGFIGSHIVDELIRKGHYVRIFDNLEPQVHTQAPTYLNEDAEFIQGDVRDIHVLEAVIKDMDIIFHEAAMVGIGQSMYQVKRYVDANTAGTANLLDVLINKDHDVKKLIVASSMSIYGEGTYACQDCGIVYPMLRNDEQLKNHDWEMRCPNCNKYVKPVHTNESKPLQPTSIYAITKKDQEEMSLAVGRSYGLPTVALRYFNVYGPRQALSNPYTGVCAIFSSRMKNDKSPIIFEDGLQSRDFISVHDIVQANMLALSKSNADYNVFNVGSGEQATILDIAIILGGLYGKKLLPDIVNKFRSGDIRHCFADISKIRKLGFEPAVSIDTGMKELVDWGKMQESEDLGDKAYSELKERGLVEN
jgi:dTDP-L-rhamnose 4-epimerase